MYQSLSNVFCETSDKMGTTVKNIGGASKKVINLTFRGPFIGIKKHQLHLNIRPYKENTATASILECLCSFSWTIEAYMIYVYHSQYLLLHHYFITTEIKI